MQETAPIKGLTSPWHLTLRAKDGSHDVGHSYGGMIVRLYARETVGLARRVAAACALVMAVHARVNDVHVEKIL